MSTAAARPKANPSPLWTQIFTVVLAGFGVGLAFTPYGLWPLAPLGVATFALAVRDVTGKRATLLGYCFGLAMFSLTIAYVNVLGWWIGALLVAFMSLYGALLGFTQQRVMRLAAWPVWIACTWTLAEFLWSRIPFGGFGWTRFAYTVPDQPLAGWLPILGAAGTGWFVGLTGGLLALIISEFAKKKTTWRSIAAIAVIGAMFAGGALLSMVPVDDGGEPVNIAIVQGNVDGTAGSHAMGYARSVTNNHLSETITAMARARTGVDPMPDFVLWPENATDLDPTKDAETGQTVQNAIKLSQTPVLIGAVMQGPGEGNRQTTSLWYSVDGQLIDRYDKRNAVPFGEFTPMKDLVFAIYPEAKQVGAQTVPGTEPGVMDVSLADGSPLKVGAIICYELAYDQTIYDTARGNPEVLVVQSNNATYTGTVQPKQQFTITRVRAMETRREIVVATTASFSGLIDAHGRTIVESLEATAASTTVSVPRRSGVTPAMRLGPWLEIVAAISAVGAVAAGGRANRSAQAKLNDYE